MPRVRIAVVAIALVALFLLVPAGRTAFAAEQAPQANGEVVYIVQRGDTLFRLSRAFQTTVQAIAQRNDIVNPHRIFVGQRLIIPVGVEVVGPVEAIVIEQPTTGAVITSPVRVSGVSDPTFEQTLVVRVTDQEGNVVATEPTIIQAELGQRGPYSVDVAFPGPGAGEIGIIQVLDTSAATGAITHLASVLITFGQ